MFGMTEIEAVTISSSPITRHNKVPPSVALDPHSQAATSRRLTQSRGVTSIR